MTRLNLSYNTPAIFKSSISATKINISNPNNTWITYPKYLISDRSIVLTHWFKICSLLVNSNLTWISKKDLHTAAFNNNWYLPTGPDEWSTIVADGIIEKSHILGSWKYRITDLGYNCYLSAKSKLPDMFKQCERLNNEHKLKIKKRYLKSKLSVINNDFI